MNKLRPFLVLLLVGAFFLNSSGCSSHDFSFKNLAKSDLDEVADYHYKEIESLLKDLTFKLYKRNPKYLKNLSGYANLTDKIDYRLKQIFDRPKKTKIPEVAAYGIDAIELSLSRKFQGDRVLAFIGGLTDMIKKSYGYNTEFFIYTELKEQNLYLSARNLEIAFWRITSYKNKNGEPFILTNSRNGEIENLSYERIFGKMIALQDMMARISSRKNERIVKTVVQNVAAKAFFPF